MFKGTAGIRHLLLLLLLIMMMMMLLMNHVHLLLTSSSKAFHQQQYLHDHDLALDKPSASPTSPLNDQVACCKLCRT